MPSRKLTTAGLGLARQSGRAVGACWARVVVSKQLGSAYSTSSRRPHCPSTPSPARQPSSTVFTPHTPPAPGSAPFKSLTCALLSAAPVTIVDPETGLPLPDQVDEAVSLFQPLANLILASPLPSYGLTIIVLTVLLRTGITLPVAVWQRSRFVRMKDVVEPQVEAYARQIKGPLLVKMRSEGYGPDEFNKEYKKRVADHQYALHRKHKTHPQFTMIAPLLVHFPLLVGFSLTLGAALNAPASPLAASSFLWIEKLADPDIGLAFLGAGLSFLNAEISSRRSELRVLNLEKLEQKEMAREMNKAEERALAGQARQAGQQGAKTPAALQAALQSARQASASASASASALATAPSQASTAASAALPSLPKPGASSLHRKVKPGSSSKRSISTSPILLAARPPPPPGPPSRRRPPSPSRPSPPSANVTPVVQNPPSISTAKAPTADLTPPRTEKPGLKASERAAVSSGFFTGVMRVSSVIFLCLASQVSSGLSLYWVTSMAFSVVQNMFFATHKPRSGKAEQSAEEAKAAAAS